MPPEGENRHYIIMTRKRKAAMHRGYYSIGAATDDFKPSRSLGLNRRRGGGLSAEEELFEVGEGGGELHALLCAFDEGFELLGNLDGVAYDVVHGVLELGGVGCLEEYAHFVRLGEVAEGLVAAGAVGVEEVAVLAMHALDGVGNLVVGVVDSGDVGDDCLVVGAVEVENAGEIRGVAHVHSVGDGGHRGARPVLA